MWRQAEDFLLKDRYIGVLVKKYGKCRIRPRPRKFYFEDLVDSIIQQQLSMRAASSIFNRVKERIADIKDTKSYKKHRWRVDVTKDIKVTPDRILALSDEELRECGLSRAKVTYVKDLASRVGKGEVEIQKMDKLSDEEIIGELVAVKGIGVWTAHMFLMFTLARPDVFPIGDLGLRNAFKKVIGKDLDIKEIEKFALRWKPYRSVASWYLWRTLENG